MPNFTILPMPYGLILGVLAMCTGCRETAKEPLVLIVSGDTAGWIVPCGCSSNQSGGLLRRGTYLQTVASKTSAVYVDVGGAIHGTSEYDVEKFEAILRGESLMNVEAHNIGAGEASLGLSTLHDSKSKTRVPFISCNVRQPNGEHLGEPIRVVSKAGRRVALVGVCSDQVDIPGVRIDPPRDSILKILATSKLKYDALVVLAYLNEADLTRLASELPEADVIIGGPTGQSVAPRRIGPTLIASATNKGKFLARLEAPSDKSTDWTGTIVEMDSAWSDDPKQQANLRDYYRALDARDLPAEKTPFVPAMASSLPSSFQVAGLESCRDCHRSDCTSWQATPHSTAWQSLTRTSAQVDAYCQQCHTTSFGMPGGFVSAKRTPARINVSCESCHGPSKAHVDDPTVHTAYFGQAINRCDSCHDRENSPHFARQDYWLKIKHGEKLE